MASRVIQIDAAHLPELERLGIPHKDVTARERHLKLTINRLKCDLAGDSQRYFVVERKKFAALCRVAELARALPLRRLAGDDGPATELAERLRQELRSLGKVPSPE